VKLQDRSSLRSLTSASFDLIPATITEGEDESISLFQATILYSEELARGVTDQKVARKDEHFCFYAIACPLTTYGLVEHVRVTASVMWQRLALSRAGLRFVTEARFSTCARKMATRRLR
jgi:hypothetical protein